MQIKVRPIWSSFFISIVPQSRDFWWKGGGTNMAFIENEHLMRGHSDPAEIGSDHYVPAKKVLIVPVKMKGELSVEERIRLMSEGRYDSVEELPDDSLPDEGKLITAAKQI